MFTRGTVRSWHRSPRTLATTSPKVSPLHKITTQTRPKHLAPPNAARILARAQSGGGHIMALVAWNGPFQ